MPTSVRRAPARSRSRAPDTKLRKTAQAMSGLALETLGKIMSGDGQDSVRLAAAREVLDRAHGRPQLGEADVGPEGLTVVVKRFTDAPNPEAGQFEER